MYMLYYGEFLGQYGVLKDGKYGRGEKGHPKGANCREEKAGPGDVA